MRRGADTENIARTPSETWPAFDAPFLSEDGENREHKRHQRVPGKPLKQMQLAEASPGKADAAKCRACGGVDAARPQGQ